MMQKWQIPTSLCSTIRCPARSSSQCAFSTSQSRLDDERPRSNRQASAKAGRLIANLAPKNPDRMKDPKFGLRGLKPYADGQKDGAPKTFTIRKVEVRDSDPPPSRDSFTTNRKPSGPRQQSLDRTSDRGNSGSRQPTSGRFATRNPFVKREETRTSRPPREVQTADLKPQARLEYYRTQLIEGQDEAEGGVKSETQGKELDKEDEKEKPPEYEELDEEDEDYAEKWEQSAYEGFDVGSKTLDPGQTPYNPKPMLAEELHTSFITTGAGELGVAAAAKQAMGRLGRRADLDYQYDAELASRLYRGEVVRFRDAEEKKRVIEKAEEFASNTANRIMAKKGEWEPKIDVGFVPVPEEVKEQLAGKAMRGLYPPVPSVGGRTHQEKTMAHLRRSVLLNETYSPTQGKSMVDFIAQMWPAENPTKSPKSSKRKDT